MTRDPARIDPILADLRRYWHAAPDLRLGQMVMGLLNLSGAPRYGEFNAEDDKVAAYLAAWAAANHPPPDHRDAEIARLRALRDRYFAAAVATADAIDGGSLGPVHSGGESDAEFQAECVRFAEGLPARAAKVRAELASIDGALRDCYALARAKLARESRPGSWADIVRFCERAGIKASPLRSAEARDAAKADVPTPPPEIEAAITAAAWSIAELDRRADVMAQPEIGAIRTAITSALAAAREAGRQDAAREFDAKILATAPDIDTAIEAVLSGERGDAYALRAAIAADKAALDATWRAHDLERDAEVAQAQAATHEACAALQAICAALHVTPSTGSTYCAEAVAMVVERVAADKARAVEGMRPVLSQADAERLVGDFNASPYDGSNDCPARAALLAALTGADAPKPTQCGAVDMLRGTICPTCGAREEFAPGPPTGELRRQMDAAAVEMCADCAALAGAGGGR